MGPPGRPAPLVEVYTTGQSRRALRLTRVKKSFRRRALLRAATVGILKTTVLRGSCVFCNEADRLTHSIIKDVVSSDVTHRWAAESRPRGSTYAYCGGAFLSVQ